MDLPWFWSLDQKQPTSFFIRPYAHHPIQNTALGVEESQQRRQVVALANDIGSWIACNSALRPGEKIEVFDTK